MNKKYNEKLHDILSYSREETIRLGNSCVEVDHLFLGLLRAGKSNATDLLEKLYCDTKKIKAEIELDLRQPEPLNQLPNEGIPVSKNVEKLLKIITLEAAFLKSEIITEEHLLLAILKDSNAKATQIMNMQNITYDRVKEVLQVQIPQDSMIDEPQKSNDDAASSSQSQKPTSSSTSQKRTEADGSTHDTLPEG